MSKYRTLLSLFLFAICLAVSAQSDSSRLRFSGFQIDINTAIYTWPDILSQQQFQAMVPADQLLDVDLSGYEKEGVYFTHGRHFQAMAGGKVFFKRKRALCSSELFVGLRYGEGALANSSYQKENADTLDSKYDSQSGHFLHTLRVRQEIFDYSIWGRRIFLPLGITISTNQDRFAWISAGLEITPFISVDHWYEGYYQNSTYITLAIDDREPMGPGNPEDYASKTSRQQVSGIGTGFYAGIPVAVFLRPFVKTHSCFRHVSAFANLMPLFAASDSWYSKPSSRWQINAGAGLRFSY